MKRIVVIGGGIAGLATAYELGERAARVPGGLEVRLVEAAERLGGNLRTELDAGYRVEWGPNGFLDNVPETLDLVRRLGLEGELCPADAAAARRFLFRNGRLHLLPGGPGSFLACPVLSLGGRLRVLGEPFAAKHPGGDETVYAFARRRIGAEAAHVLVGAMVSGVFAGDARELSLASCFPKMAEMEAEHGGLVKAMLAKQRARGAARRELAKLRARGEDAPEMERPGGPVGPAGRLTSFRGGIQTFTAALAARLGDAAESGRGVHRLERIDGREGTTRLWRITFARGELLEADEVVLAVPAAQAAPLLAPLDDELAATVGAIPSASLAVLALAYDEKAFRARALTPGAGAPNGFGFLVPRDPSGAGPRILGALWDSSVFPGERAPAGKVLLRVMIGGALDPEAVGLSEDELLAIARTDLAATMGLTAAESAPERHWLFRHRVGISQYTVGHAARLATIAARLTTLPGLHVAGQSYFGVSMNGCCEQAARFAEARIRSFELANA